MPSSKPISEILSEASIRDGMTVTPDGKSCGRVIHGVKIRDLVLHTDARGTLCELYDPRWEFHEAPMVFSYFYTVRPGWVKGWAMHKTHEDRYCLIHGELKVVLYDAREDSPTFGLVQEIFMTEHPRQLLSIPTGVWHADHNIGQKDVLVVNFPTIPYNHSAPDKYRLPVGTNLIPYQFGDIQGF
jgi:dTDP-4-dehydrorhamnose 3,5-epimerase